MTGAWTPYEEIKSRVEGYARLYGYDDYLVTINLAGQVVTELLICDNGDLEWLSDWWEGERPVKLLGFIPLSHIKIYGNAVEIGRPVFGPDPVKVSMAPIGHYKLEVCERDGT